MYVLAIAITPFVSYLAMRLTATVSTVPARMDCRWPNINTCITTCTTINARQRRVFTHSTSPQGSISALARASWYVESHSGLSSSHVAKRSLMHSKAAESCFKIDVIVLQIVVWRYIIFLYNIYLFRVAHSVKLISSGALIHHIVIHTFDRTIRDYA